MHKSADLAQEKIICDFSETPILSTGGYNNHFLKFISNIFNSQIVKCRDFMHFVINAIDYLNKSTNDCFYKL